MPGGTGGPHRIQGVGFWAQQKYYNIFSVDSGPFIFRPLQRSLPEAWWVPPANAFQSWTYFNPNLQVAPPQTVFRGPLKGLPEQPPPPLLQQSVFQSWRLLYGAVQMPAGQQIYDLPQQPWRLEQTWTFQYNLNLIGKDATLVGEQVYALAPSQVVPDQIQLRAWSWSYNLNLIGQDRRLAGAQRYELAPGQVSPEQIQLHSWTWRQVDKLGKDQLPIGEQVYELTQGQRPPDQIQLRSWQWNYNLNLIAQDKLPIGEQAWERPTLPIPPAQAWTLNLLENTLAGVPSPFAQTDWPLPTAPYRVEQSWFWKYNPNLIGKDQLPAGEQVYELTQAQKPYEQQQLHSWQWNYNLNLIGQDRFPTGETTWERPTLPIPPAQTWTASYGLSLIGQDKLPTGAQISELPPRDFARLFQTWISSVNAALVVTPPVLDILKPQRDWPVPKGPEPDWRRSWEWQYNKNLIGQDQLPFRQSDWPIAVPPVQVQGWIDQTKILLAQPVGPLGTIANQFDWPLPQRQPQQIQTWTNTITALILGAKPFAQTDWPNPIPLARDPTLSTIAASYNKNLIGQDRLPNRQQDWPLSSAHALSQIPLQIMVQGKWFNLVPPTPLGLPLTSGRLFDRPQLRPDSAADIAWPAWRWPQITPPPVSAVVPLRTLMGTGV